MRQLHADSLARSPHQVARGRVPGDEDVNRAVRAPCNELPSRAAQERRQVVFVGRRMWGALAAGGRLSGNRGRVEEPEGCGLGVVRVGYAPGCQKRQRSGGGGGAVGPSGPSTHDLQAQAEDITPGSRPCCRASWPPRARCVVRDKPVKLISAGDNPLVECCPPAGPR